MFSCEVSHDSQVSIDRQWILTKSSGNGNIEEKIPSSSRQTVDSEGTLTMEGVNSLDIGSYTCRVISVGGNDSQTLFLQILGKIFYLHLKNYIVYLCH